MAKSNVGVSLDEVIASLNKNQEAISPALKQLMEEQSKIRAQQEVEKQERRARRTGKKAPAPANTTPVAETATPTKEAEAKKPKVGHDLFEAFLKGLVGRDLARALMRKRVPAKFAKDGLIGPARDNDLKAIKADIAEIHEYLMGQKKPLGPHVPRSATQKPSLKGYALHGALSALGLKMPERYLTVGAERMKTKTMTAARVPTAQAPAEIADYQQKVREEMERMEPGSTAPAAQPEAAPAAEAPAPAAQPEAAPAAGLPRLQQADEESGQQAHADVAKEKAEEARAADAKATHDKLDKILKLLGDMKDNLGKKGGLGGMLLALLAGFKWLKTAVSKLGSMIGAGLKSVVKSVGKLFSSAWSKLKGLGSKAKNLFKGAENVTKDIGKEGEKLLGKDALKTVEKVGAKGLIKDIPIVGAVAGAGFAAYDLAKGNKADAGFDLSSGLASTVPGLGTAASAGIDVAQAAYDLKHPKPPTTTATSGIIQRPAPSPIPTQLPTALAGATATNQQLKADQSAEPKVVVIQQPAAGGNRPTVLPPPPPPMIVSPRNGEPSIDLVNAGLYDFPQSWGMLYRM